MDRYTARRLQDRAAAQACRSYGAITASPAEQLRMGDRLLSVKLTLDGPGLNPGYEGGVSAWHVSVAVLVSNGAVPVAFWPPRLRLMVGSVALRALQGVGIIGTDMAEWFPRTRQILRAARPGEWR